MSRSGNMRSTFFLAIVILVAGSASCLRKPEVSQLAIDSGQLIKVDYANKASGVVSIGGCTATIVSTNTLVLAAHCAQSGTRICIASPPYNGLCSTKYQTNAMNENMGKDVSVAIFDGQPFQHIFPVTDREPVIGEQDIMIGYSSQNLPDASGGSKRWGFNRIANLQPFEYNSIENIYGGNQNSVVVDLGDSGGPLLNSECKLIGATSRKTLETPKRSIHTNLFSKVNTSFFDTMVAQGAHFCKVGENSPQCPAAFMYGRVANPQAEPDGAPGFPCAPGANDNHMAVFTRNADKTGATMDKAIVYYATSVAGKTFGYCLNTSAEECTPNHEGFKTVKKIGESSFRKLYKIVEPYAVSNTSHIAMVVYGENNKLLSSRVVVVSPK